MNVCIVESCTPTEILVLFRSNFVDWSQLRLCLRYVQSFNWADSHAVVIDYLHLCIAHSTSRCMSCDMLERWMSSSRKQAIACLEWSAHVGALLPYIGGDRAYNDHPFNRINPNVRRVGHSMIGSLSVLEWVSFCDWFHWQELPASLGINTGNLHRIVITCPWIGGRGTLAYSHSRWEVYSVKLKFFSNANNLNVYAVHTSTNNDMD